MTVSLETVESDFIDFWKNISAQGDKEKARKIWTELAENNPESEASEYAKEALKKL